MKPKVTVLMVKELSRDVAPEAAIRDVAQVVERCLLEAVEERDIK